MPRQVIVPGACLNRTNEAYICEWIASLHLGLLLQSCIIGAKEALAGGRVIDVLLQGSQPRTLTHPAPHSSPVESSVHGAKGADSIGLGSKGC